jgi:hypothetical protein
MIHADGFNGTHDSTLDDDVMMMNDKSDVQGGDVLDPLGDGNGFC